MTLVRLFARFLLGVGLWVALCSAGARAEEREGIRLDADSIFLDSKKQTFEAEGNVLLRFLRPPTVLRARADRVFYDHSSRRLKARGAGLLELDEQTLLFFNRLELDRDSDTVEARGVGLRRLGKTGGASAARLKGGLGAAETIRLFDALYSPCPICADKKDKDALFQKQDSQKQQQDKKPREPLWQLRAQKIVLEPTEDAEGKDKDSARVHFLNTTFETFGVPIFYLPYLSFPRSGRGSGFLPISLGYTSRLGAFATIPVYWIPHKSLDITYAPTLSSNFSRSTSDVEIRGAWGDFALALGGSVAHLPEPDDRHRMYGWIQSDWQGALGFRADGQYHALSDLDYFTDYEKGTRILSTDEPDVLDNHFLVENFTRNGYAQARLAQFRHASRHLRALSQPLLLPDEHFLPYLLYENEGRFGTGGRASGHWRASGLWRGVEGFAQQKTSEPSILKRQDLISARGSSGGAVDLGASFRLSGDAIFRTDYYREKTSSPTSSQPSSPTSSQPSSQPFSLEKWRFLPAARVQIDGLFATKRSRSGRISYLRPILEGYASLDQTELGGITPLDEDIERYGTWGDFGVRDRSPGRDTFESGQRLSTGLRFSTLEAEGSSLSLYAASGVKRSPEERDLGRMLFGVEGTWRGQIDGRIDSEWRLADFSEVRTRASTSLNFDNTTRKFFPRASLSLTYARKSTQVFEERKEKREVVQHDLSTKGSLHITEKWRTEAWMRYNFLNELTPFDRYGIDLLYKGLCFEFKMGFETTYDYSAKEFYAFRYSLGLQTNF